MNRSSFRRTRRALSSEAVALGLLLGCGSALAQWPSLPAGAVFVDVVEGARVHGHAVDMRAVISPLDCEQTLQFVRRQWVARGLATFVDTVSGSWRILAVATPQAFVTSQWRASAGRACEGLLSRWPQPLAGSGLSPASDPPVPVPQGIRWLTRLEHTGQSFASILAGDSPFPLAELANDLRARLRDAHWRLIGERSVPGGLVVEASSRQMRGLWILTDRGQRTELALFIERNAS